MTQPIELTHQEQKKTRDLMRLNSKMIYEIIRRDGEEELARPITSIWWSGTAAGIAISFSLLMEAMLHALLPDAPWRPAVENIGYVSGFLLVIFGRMQLFTENTITTVLPTLADPCKKTVFGTAKLWTVVFLANMAGTFFAAVLIAHASIVPADVILAAKSVSHHFADMGSLDIFLRGLPAGFLIAAIVWMLPNARGNEFWVITFFIYLIALGEFAHVVVGSAELFLLMVTGELGAVQGTLFKLIPAFFGNVVGGTGLFALLAYAQVKEEMTEANTET